MLNVLELKLLNVLNDLILNCWVELSVDELDGLNIIFGFLFGLVICV